MRPCLEKLARGSGWALPIRLGSGFQLGSVFRLVLPQLDHRDARGAACVLSRRCWQDGSIHYSYCQASQVFSSCLRSIRAAHGPSCFRPQTRWMSGIAWVLRSCFGSAPRPRDHSSEFGKFPDRTQHSLLRQAECCSRLWISADFRIPADIPSDAKTSARVANELHLLPFFASRTELFCRPCHSTGGWEWWAL